MRQRVGAALAALLVLTAVTWAPGGVAAEEADGATLAAAAAGGSGIVGLASACAGSPGWAIAPDGSCYRTWSSGQNDPIFCECFTSWTDVIQRIAPDGGVTDVARVTRGPLNVAPAPIWGDLDVAPDGSIWVKYVAGGVRRYSPGGALLASGGSIAGRGRVEVGPDGAVWYTGDSTSLGHVNVAGAFANRASGATGGQRPTDLTIDANGRAWTVIPDGDLLSRVTPAGLVATWSDPQVDAPSGITVGPDGAAWFTSRGTDRLGRISSTGEISTFADPQGRVDGPTAITTGPGGLLYFASFDNQRIGVADTAGHISVFEEHAAVAPVKMFGTEDTVYLGGARLVPATGPAAPTIGRGFGLPDGARFEWSEPGDTGGLPLLGYQVFRDGVEVGAVSASVRTFDDHGLAVGETHQYRVRAVNAVGAGVLSDPKTIVSGSVIVRVRVDAAPELSEDLTFLGCGPSGCRSFVLDDDADPTYSDFQDHLNVVPGQYSITMVSDPAPHRLIELAGCPGTQNLQQRTWTFTTTSTGGGHDCRFVVRSTTIDLSFDAVPDAPADTTFRGCLGSACRDFLLDDDDDPTLPRTVTARGTVPGTYTITQRDIPDGYSFGGVACTGGRTTVNQAIARVTITLGWGDHVRCEWRADSP